MRSAHHQRGAAGQSPALVLSLVVVAFFVVAPYVPQLEDMWIVTSRQRLSEWILGRIETLFDDYGYYVVFVGVLLENSLFLGLLVPGAIILMLGGLSAENGSINAWLVAVLGIIATIIGDTISYFIGRFGFARMLERSSMAPAFEKFRKRIEKHTSWIIVSYHFAGQTRVIGPAASGMFRIPFARWAPYDYGGGAAWVVTFTLLGIFLGLGGLEFDDTQRVSQVIDMIVLGSIAVAAFLSFRGPGDAGARRARETVTVPVAEDE